MFDDRVKVFIKAGNGGNGKVSFHTQKNIPIGAPDGGDGGKGGDIVFIADKELTNLVEFRYQKHFKAEDGLTGGTNLSTGKTGKSVEVKVPCGTVIRDEESGGIIADLFYHGDKVVVLKGGMGGKGNARFKSSRRQSPTFSQSGQKTEEKNIILELKTIADVGLVGFPNAGKSSLLSVMTNARPKVANYHFTTLSPNLGVANVYGKSIIIADIPGLIEGASEGAGLGHYFLRHIERTRLFLIVLDASGVEGRDPYNDYKILNTELKKYDKKLMDVPQIVVLNKIDMPDAETNIANFMKKIKRLKSLPEVVSVSAVTHENIDTLLKLVAKKVSELPPAKPLEFEKFEYAKANPTEYEIFRDDDGAFVIVGGFVDELIRNVVLSDAQSFAYFQKLLKKKGIIKHLRKLGAKDGATIRIADFDFDFIDD